jgi:hypothetical protein
MAHAQKPDFVFRRNGRVHLNPQGASVQSTTGSRGVRISGSNARYSMFRGSVRSTGYPPHSPVSPSLPLPCVTVCHHISTGLYQPTKGQHLVYCFFRSYWGGGIRRTSRICAAVRCRNVAVRDVRLLGARVTQRVENLRTVPRLACRPSFGCSCCCCCSCTTRCNASSDLPTQFTLLRSTKQTSHVPLPTTQCQLLGTQFYKSEHHKRSRFFEHLTPKITAEAPPYAMLPYPQPALLFWKVPRLRPFVLVRGTYM